MSHIGLPLRPKRQSIKQKAFVISTWRGVIRAQSWPRKRGKPKQAYQRANNSWLSQVVRAWKAGSAETNTQTKDNAELLRLRPQDRFTHITAGREWLIVGSDGNYIYPMRFLVLMSRAIDQVCASPAATAVRTRHGWRPLPGGRAGATLVMGPELPQWSDGTEVIDYGPMSDDMQSISESMDVFGSEPGTLLYRDQSWWAALPPGQTGQVLTINEEGYPSWQ